MREQWLVRAKAPPRKVVWFETPELPGKKSRHFATLPLVSAQMTSEERAQKFHTDEVQLPITGLCFWLVEANIPCRTTIFTGLGIDICHHLGSSSKYDAYGDGYETTLKSKFALLQTLSSYFHIVQVLKKKMEVVVLHSPPPQNVKLGNFPVFQADRVIIDGLTCGQGQPSRIWKVQRDWLSLLKGLLFSVEQALAGRDEIRTPLKIQTPARDRRLGLSACARSKIKAVFSG